MIPKPKLKLNQNLTASIQLTEITTQTAKVAHQCTCPDTQTVGTFLFLGESHRIPDSRISPVCPSMIELCDWTNKNGWKSVGRNYEKTELEAG